MSTWEQVLDAGGQMRLPGGDCISIVKADYPIRVELYKGSQRLAIGNSVPVSWHWEPFASSTADDAFDAVVITSPQAQTVGVDISRGRSGVNAITGVVAVVDGGRELSLNGQAFSASSYMTAPASRYPVLQLHNPAASGKRLVVNRIRAASSVQAAITLRRLDTALTTDISSEINAKRIGSAVVSAANFYYDDTIAVFPTTRDGDLLDSTYLDAFIAHEFALSEPLVLDEGSGIAVYVGVTAAGLRCTYQFFEQEA